MHKISLLTHKDSFDDIKPEGVIDLELDKEHRLSLILSLHSKGLTQTEIAIKLRINQSTISRDLQLIKQESRRRLQHYLDKDIPFEFLRILKGFDDIIKTTWETIENSQVSCKEKYMLLSLLDMVYTKKLQLMIGGDPKKGGGLNLAGSLSDMRINELCNPE
jgi:hypothetical protein